MKKKIWLILANLALTGFLGGQEAENIGNKNDEEGKTLSTIVVTTPKDKKPSVVIEQKDLERRMPRNLREVLEFVPGVQANSRGGDDVRLSIRGSGNQAVVFTKNRGTDVLLNGFSINSADGTFDYGLVSPGLSQSSEVYLGGEAHSLGALSLGGALNLISPTGKTAVNRVRVDAGSFGFMRGLGTYGVSGKNLDGVIQFDVKKEKGFRDFSENDTQKFAFSMGAKLSPSVENRVFVHFARVNQNVSLPITQAELENNPSQGRVNGPPNNFNINEMYKPYYETYAGLMGDRLSIALDQNSLVELQLQHQYKDIDFRRPNVPIPTPYKSQRGPGWLNAISQDTGAQLKYVHQGILAGKQNDFSLGLRGSSMWAQEKLYPNIETVKGNIFADGNLFAGNLVFFMDEQYQVFDPLKIVGNLSGFYSQRNYEDKLNTGVTSLTKEQEYKGITGRLGAELEVIKSNYLFVFYNRNIEPPAFGDIISIPVSAPPAGIPQKISIQNLRTQKAHVSEAGIRHESPHVKFKSTAYYAWLDDEIIRYNPTAGIATVGNQTGINAGETRHYGVETSITTVLPLMGKHSIQVQGQYTWRRHQFYNDSIFGGNQIAGIPTMLLSAEILYQYDSGFYIGPNVTSSPDSYFVDNANTVKANLYYLLGARAGWRGQNLSLYLEGRNLANEAYVANLQAELNSVGTDPSIYFPGEGQSFYGGAEWRF